MCTVSMVVDGWTSPGSPNFIPWTPTFPPPATAQQMLEVLEKLDKLDKRLGAIECKVEEAKKEALKRKLKRRAKRAK